MKRIKCPKCDHYIIFDETKYVVGQSLVFQCDECGKEFGIRIGVSKMRNNVSSGIGAPRGVVMWRMAVALSLS